MAWKRDEKGTIVEEGENPVWLGEDGSEISYDAKANNIAAATAKRESAESRRLLKELQAKMEAYNGIEDPEAARQALQLAHSMDGKKILDDEGIKRMIETSVKPWQEKTTTLESSNIELQKELYKEKVSKQFASSRFLNEKTFMTPDVAESFFGKHFKLEYGKVVASDSNGNTIYSNIKAGEIADFEEAISIIFNNYENKDRYSKGSGASGSGSQGSNSINGNSKNSKEMTRSEWNNKTPYEQSSFALSGGKVTE